MVTLATVGYGDFAPHTAFGELFTTFYIFVGVGILATFITYNMRRYAGTVCNRVGDGLPDVRPTNHAPVAPARSFGRVACHCTVGERQADTAEQLMRARYSAYAVGDLDYVWRTWHPRTRPDDADTGRRIDVDRTGGRRRVDGRPGDESGEVEFRAHYRESRRSGQSAPDAAGTLHERSRFAVRARRWFYVDGELFG